MSRIQPPLRPTAANLAMAAMAAALPWLAPPAAAAPPPNVVMIISDDQAWYDYSFMRRPGVEPIINTMAGPSTDATTNMRIRNVVRTPNIDQLADEGLAFTRGYNPTSLCRPSLASMITGLHPYQHKITGNNEPSGQDAAYDNLILNVPSLPRTLGSERGYTSFQTGKWWQGHYSTGGFTSGNTANSTSTAYRPPQWSGPLPSYAPARHGDWGLIVGRVDYTTDAYAEPPPAPLPPLNTLQPVTDFIDTQVAAGQPFFVWYAPMLPHTPHYPPASLVQYYTGLGIDTRTAQYYANVELWDATVGALMNYLKAKGIDDNTLVIYVVDNGWIQDPNGSVTGDTYLGAANNGATSKSKRSAYDGGLRTPILVRWPAGLQARGLTPGLVTTPVSTVDIAATVLAAAGLPPPANSWGLDLLDDDALAARTEMYGDVYQHDVTAAAMTTPSAGLRYSWIIRDGWKFIRRHVDAGGDMLFRLQDYQADPAGAAVDPFEITNLIVSQPTLAQELRTLHQNWYGTNAPAQPPRNDDFVRADALSGDAGTTLAWNNHASQEGGEPQHAGAAGGRSVWWRWTAGASGSVSLDTHASRIDTLLAVYTGNDLQSLSLVAANDDDGQPGGVSGLSFHAQAGTTYHIVVDGKAGAAGTLTLSRGFSPDPPPLPSADLAISLGDAPDPVQAGAPLTYSLVVQNQGPDAAAAVTVSHTLPASASFLGASGTDCSHAGGVVTCALGGLAAGQQASRDIQVTLSQIGIATSLATVGSDTPDPQPGNDSATAATQVTAAAGGGQDGDVPLPAWALAVLAGGLLASMGWRQRSR